MEGIEDLKELPRSERVEVVFNFSATSYQADLLDHYEGQKKTQAAPKKGRQVGASLVGSVLAADYALTHRNTDVLITSAKQDPADELFEKFTQHFKNSDFTLDQLGVVEDNKTQWKFSNETRVICRTLGQGDLSQRSLSPSFVIVDEAAYASDYHLEEVIEPFFITHDTYEWYLFSTPKGKSGYFYHAVEGNNSDEWYSPHWPTEISPFADEEYLERKQKEKDRTTYAQEYEGEFADVGEAWLPSSTVKPCVQTEYQTTRTEKRWLGVDPAEKGKDEMVIYDIGESGKCHNIWSKETVTGPDFVGLLTNLHQSETVPDPDWGTGTTPPYGYERIVVESNMAGLATDILQSGIGNVVLPVKSTRKSKGPMYKRLKRDLEATELTLPDHVKLLNQTTSLQYEYTANGHIKIHHPKGQHDDYPDALMLANAGRTGIAQNYSTDIEGQSNNVPLAW